MASIANVLKTQKTLEESLLQRMADFEQHLKATSTAPSPASDLKSLASDFCQFKEMVGGILTLLRQQITVLLRSVDIIETRHRRKTLLFSGVEENEGEDLQTSIISVCHKKLGLNNVSSQSITSCHRLGASRRERPRPVLVRFADIATKSEVWNHKSKLKGSPITLSEFLTRHRQDLFAAARRHFGIRNVWTNDGNIIVKLSDGKLSRIFDNQDLDRLTAQHPQEVPAESSAAQRATAPIAAYKTNVRPQRAVKK